MQIKNLKFKAALCAAMFSIIPHAFASGFSINDAARLLHSATDKAPGTAQTEIAFSPDGASEALILKVINSSRKSLRLAAYSFTSPAITRALLNAKRRGVDVAVLVDHDHNISKGSAKAKAALNLLVNAGIPTRTVSRFQIFHDKFVTSDGLHVQTGSYNYSEAAARRNSENVIVLWNHPEAAASYLRHWQRRYEQGEDYRSSY